MTRHLNMNYSQPPDGIVSGGVKGDDKIKSTTAGK